MSKKHIHLCMHFHCDPIFTCPQSIHIAESVDLAHQYVSMFRDEPDFRCILSEIDYLQGYWNTHVTEREEFLDLLRRGLIETSGSYSEPNESSVGGEGLVRNLAYGQWFLVDYLGARGDVYMPFDVFGHVRQLPQLLAKSGFQGAVWTKGSDWGANPAWWVAPDGSRVINCVASYGSIDWGTGDQLRNLMNGVSRRLSRGGDESPATDIGFRGSDFVSPPWWVVGSVGEMRDESILLSVPSAYFDELRRQTDDEGLRLTRTTREMTQYHIGTALSRTELKIGNRLGEQAALEAEIWGTIASLYGEPYPEAQLDHAWRQLLFSQHHDSITGTSNDQSYLDLMSHLRESLAEGVQACERAVHAIAGRVDTGAADGTPVVVFNSNSFAQTGTVEIPLPEELEGAGLAVRDAEGNELASERSADGASVRVRVPGVPGVGHTTFWLSATDEDAGDRKPEMIHSDYEPVTITTPFARITFDPARGGCITSLVETATGRDLAGSTGPQLLNDFVCLKEGAGPEPAWEVHTSGGKFFSSTVRARFRAERTASGWRILIEHPFPDTDGVVRTVELFDDDPRMDCTVDLMNYAGSRLFGDDRFTRPWGGLQEFDDGIPEDRDLFGVLFPTGLEGTAPVWSDRFGQRVIRRAEGWLDYRTHQRRNESGCALYSAEQWIAQSPSTSIVVGDPAERRGVPFTMVKVVYPAADATLRDLSERLVIALGAQGVTATPAPDSEAPEADPLQTKQIITLGGAESNEWSKRALEGASLLLANRLLADIVAKEGVSLPVLVLQGASDDVAAEVEKVISELEHDAVVVDGACCASSRVVDLEDTGLAVMNRGTIAAGCESDGALFLALQHTAYWCDWATPSYLGFPFVPERKTTRYEYSLMPFAGSWRDARLPERAQAYNRPLRAALTDRHEGDVAPTRQWLRVDGEGCLLSALKPAGNPSARLSGDVVSADRGTVARVWNWSGEAGDVRLRFNDGATEAVTCDLAERPAGTLMVAGGEVSVPVGANAVETVLLKPEGAGASPAGNALLPTQVAESRWWLTNAGAASMGNTPVSVSLTGDMLPGEDGVVTLGVANNRRDAEFVGVVELRAPEGWVVSPARVDVMIPAMGTFTAEISVRATEAGRLIAKLTDGPTTYQDTLVIGEVSQPEVTVTAGDDAIDVRVSNPSADALALNVTLISPLETWSEAGALATRPVNFRIAPLSLAPGEQRTLWIPVPQGLFENTWAFVKVSGHGEASYHPIPQRYVATRRGGSFAAPRADAWVLVEGETDATARISITRQTVPPSDCAHSPVSDVTKYWITEPVGTAPEPTAAAVEFGIIPKEIASLSGPEDARIAVWASGVWNALATTFDRHTWTLTAAIDPALLGEKRCWTIVGSSCLEWRTNLGGRFFESYPWVGDIDGDGKPETVIGTARNQIALLDSDGAVRWRRHFGGWIWPSTAFEVADINGDGALEIIAAPSDRTLGVMDADGRWLWKREDLPFAIKQRPTVFDINGDGRQEILVPINDDALWAFSAEGDLLWKAPLERMRYSPAAGLEGEAPRMLVNVGATRLAFVTPTGEVEREIVFGEGAARARIVAEPVVTTHLHAGAQEILHGGHDGKLRLLTAEGELVWETDLGSPIVSAPLVLEGANGEGPIIVCNTFGQHTYGLDAEGKQVWARQFNSNIQGSPAAADMDGDGALEIVVSAAREKKTHVLKRDGTPVGVIPFATIWACTPAFKLSANGAAPTVILGGLEECVMSAWPFKVNP